MSIHYGHFLRSSVRMPVANPMPGGPKTVEVIKTEEKGSDVNLATRLLVDAFQEDADAFVVVSNDSDLMEPTRVVCHDLGFVVGIVNPHEPKKRSHALNSCTPTFFKQIRPNVLKMCQLPQTLRDAAGRTIRKPRDW